MNMGDSVAIDLTIRARVNKVGKIQVPCFGKEPALENFVKSKPTVAGNIPGFSIQGGGYVCESHGKIWDEGQESNLRCRVMSPAETFSPSCF